MTITQARGTAVPGSTWTSYLSQGPRPFVVQPARFVGLEELVGGFTSWVLLPERTAPVSPSLADAVRSCRQLTGWSTRELGTVLGTSHTTVRMLESTGTVSARSRAAASRVQPLLGVLTRLARVAGTRDRLALALESSNNSGERAIDLLSHQQWSRAFSAGLDGLRTPDSEMRQGHDGWDGAPATWEMR